MDYQIQSRCSLDGVKRIKKITRRTTGAKGNKFLRVITSFNKKASDSKYQKESNRYQEADNM